MSVWAEDENNDNLKQNKKLLMVGNYNQLTNLPVTTEGQLIFCTSGNSTFPSDKLRSRLAGNSSWSAILQESSAQALGTTDISFNKSVNAGRMYIGVSFTLPSTEKFYTVTSLSWTVGSTTGGTVFAGVIYYTSSSSTSLPLVALTQEASLGSTNTLQTINTISSLPVRGGTSLRAFIQTSASKEIKGPSGTTADTQTIAYNANPNKAIPYTFASNAGEPAIQVYVRGYS